MNQRSKRGQPPTAAEAAALARVRVPAIAVKVTTSNGDGTTFGDVMLRCSCESQHSLADKLRELANVVGSSEGLLDHGTILVIGVRR